MEADITGGYEDSREYGFTDYPNIPAMRDSVNFWFCDEQGRFGMPRCVMESIGPDWENNREAMINIAFPDNRVYSLRQTGLKAAPSERPSNGRVTAFDAGSMIFNLLEPFKRWTASFKGECAETTATDQMNGTHPSGSGRRMVPIEFEIEMDMAVPPWVPTTHLEEGLRKILTDEELAFTHEWGPCHRHEQLFNGKGTLKIGDNETYSFQGTGLRVRRQNILKVATFTGHVWQSALFPSGKAFGSNIYAPRPDGKPSYSEGWVFDGSEVLPARVVQVNWLTKATPSGDDVSLVLETRKGFHHIKGETFVSTFDSHRSRKASHLADLAFSPFLQQANARYTWEGEEAYGMLERSISGEKLG